MRVVTLLSPNLATHGFLEAGAYCYWTFYSADLRSLCFFSVFVSGEYFFKRPKTFEARNYFVNITLIFVKNVGELIDGCRDLDSLE